MCKHVFTEEIEKEYYDRNLECRAQKIKRTCIFCGKEEREVHYMKDPPKRKLPRFYY